MQSGASPRSSPEPEELCPPCAYEDEPCTVPAEEGYYYCDTHVHQDPPLGAAPVCHHHDCNLPGWAGTLYCKVRHPPL